MSDNIKVVVKVRPLITRELEDKLVCQWRIKSNTLYLLDQNGKETGQNFIFDKVYTEDTKTTDVYKDVVKPIVEGATAGINGTIFAYGQTSSGKTYTMTGTKESPGIIPLAVQDLFHIIKNIPDRDFLVRVSYIEIYNDTINDMLNIENKNVRIFESLQGLKVEAEEKILRTPEEVLEVMETGQSNRHVGSTNMNDESSRSHSIFQITIESREHVNDEEEMGCVIVSQLNLVDLAGSERAGQTGAKGMRFVEGTHINKSLSTLALVIRQLSEEPKKFISYRNSNLTRILQNSLGGNARTCIVCAVTPAAVEETISTLQFANRAKVIKNKPEVNAVTTSNTMLQNLTRQMCKLQSQLESKKHLEKDNVNLQKQLVALQQLIINGFNQRSTINIVGIQKKQSQLRRATISALPSNENDMNVSPPQIKPKFCTPLLKYNPACIEGAPEFSANLGSIKPTLSPVHEENAKTPPRKKTVNFESEIIEIDSGDEENTSDPKVCSPIHDCYDSSKTPPCVLRKTVKQVERSLKEHIEMTELEKMYSPKVVELIQQLQQKTTMINEMKEERNKLYKQIKDRDFEVDILKHKIHKTEEEMKSTADGKINLEMEFLDIKTKLTDLEVIYETLKKKSKRREDELLSLIENEKNRIPSSPKLSLKTQFGEKLVTNFMDLSKDISLVNSDNENSMDGHTIHTLQGHINEPNETIVELETKVEEQKLHNAQLQKTIENLQLELADFNKKIKESDNDRHGLKSIIESLESKISRQETDITSYNDVIRELQIKLTKKDLTNIQLNDSAIESILKTEENLFNNSENLKIVCQLKQAVDTRDSEISVLKSSIDLLELKNNGSENITLTKQLQDKDDYISNLMENIHTLKEQDNQYLITIKKLSENIVDLEEQITKLKEQNIQNVSVIEDLNTQISNLNITVEDKTEALESLGHNLENKLQHKEGELLSANTKIDELTKEIDKHLFMVNQLEEKVTGNNNQISSQLEVIKETNDKIEQLLKDKNDLNNIINEKNGALELCHYKIDELNRGVIEKDKQIKRLEEASDSEVHELKLNMDTYSKEREDWVILEKQLIDKLEHIQNKMETSEKILQEKNIQIDELKSTIENIQNTMLKRDNDLQTLNHTNEDLADQNRELNYLVLELRKTVEDNKLLITSMEENKSSEIKSLITQFQKNINRITGIEVPDPPENNNENLETVNDILNRLESTISAIVIEKQNLNTKLSESTDLYTAEVMNLREQMIEEERKLSEIIVQIEELASENARLSEELNMSLICCAQFEEKYNSINSQYINLIQQQSCNVVETPKTELHNTCTNCDCFHKILPNLLHLVTITSNNTHKIDTSDTFAHTTSEKILMLIQTLDENIKYSMRAKNIHESTLLEEQINNGEEYKSETEACMHKLLKYQLHEKSMEIQELQSKSNKLKNDFENLGVIMKNQLNELQSENMRLKAKCHNKRLSHSLGTEKDNIMLDTSINDLSEKKPNGSPPSLLNMCLIKIDSLLKSEQSEPEFNNSVSEKEQDPQTHNCPCLILDYEGLKNMNIDLMIRIEDLNIHNKTLLNEQEEVRSEINLLLELIKELQKKIFNHRTNLSTLTATTYAENQLLQTQVKALQHHHNRFYNACLRDIPSFKKQLEQLSTILKDDESNNFKHNISFKRYSLPDVLDNNCSFPNTHNESTLDGDLLMLDTNVTIATLDNTLLGLDRTHTDTIQITSELNKTSFTDNSNLPLQVEISSSMNTQLSLLTNENKRLQEQIIMLSLQKEINEAQTNQTDARIDDIDLQSTLLQKIEKLSNELSLMAEQKQEMETKYQKHILDIPFAQTLEEKNNILEQEIISKNKEVNKLKHLLEGKTKQLNGLQVEYDEISTQVIDTISEVDSLKKEVTTLEEINVRLKDECFNLKKIITDYNERKNSVCIESNPIVSHKHLNRSLSDSDSCSSYNTICTLQKELCAGKEECKQLTEEVTTIKNHLEQSNLSAMDLDESVNNPNVFTTSSSQHITKSLQPIKENVTECFEYIIEKTGLSENDIDSNLTLIDLMKILHDKLVLEHGNEIQNLLNHVKILEDAKLNLKDEICSIKQELQDTNKTIVASNSKITQIKNNIETLNNNLHNLSFGDIATLSSFRDSVLVIFDSEYGTNSSFIFNCIMDSIVKKNESTLHEIINSNKQLQLNIESLVTEKKSVLANLEQLQNEMDKKEQDYNTLKTQKELIHEISEAVTLDIIKKEKDFNQAIIKGCEKLTENNIICPHEVDIDAPAFKNLNMLLDNIIEKRNTEKQNIMLEIKNSKELLNRKEREVEELQKDMDRFNVDAEKISENVIDYAKKLESQNALYEDLKNVYETKNEENIANIKLIEKLTEEIVILKQALSNKEEQMKMLEKEVNKDNLCNKCYEKESYILDLSEKIKNFEQETQILRTTNAIINSEKDSLKQDLEKANSTIRENSLEMDKMKSDIMVLKEATTDNLCCINRLKEEAKSLLELNSKLKDQFSEKCHDFSRLEINIKTHEKTAEIQSKMIMRLTSQHNIAIQEKDHQIEELLSKESQLQKQYEECLIDCNTAKENIQKLLTTKEELERRVAQLERERDEKQRFSTESSTDHSKKRRQSVHDSKRLFGDQGVEDNNKLEALFQSRSKLDDLFMDVDEESNSNRTSPIKNKKNDSNQSRLEEVSQDSSRPSSVLATRRRRQSVHDAHRSIVHSPHDQPGSPFLEDFKHSDSSNRSAHESDASQLKERIATYLEEIEELKQRNQELDEECDTCAEYLKERDEQCLRLKKEKSALEKIIEELQEKVKTCNPQQSQLEESKRFMVNASVNTDEDWANLHSVVVDRMSYDAEVDKNKRLTKVIEELRYKKQELRTTIGKMQAALDRNYRKESDELEELKTELEIIKQELNEVKQRNKELDEECDTCAQYLREREQQCRKLKEAKESLEVKLEELQNDHSVTQSLRKKRQSIYDQNRPSNSDLHDACTQIGHDLVTYQKERDAAAKKTSDDARELKRLKMTVDKLLHQKASLEQQVVTLTATVQPALYVATGSAIVQNQQITDVMKENQKLKNMNAKLVSICKKRGKMLSESNRENEDPTDKTESSNM